jgi:hypothetical protein
MGAQNQTTVNLVGVGGVPPYTFQIIQDAKTTVPATVAGSTLSVDASGLQPGVYSVHVGVTDASGNTSDMVVSIRATDPSVFAILNTSTSLSAVVFPGSVNLPLLSIGGVGTVQWSLISSATTLPGASIVGGVLQSSVSSFGTWTVGLRATDSLKNSVTKLIEVSVITISSATVVDGQIELDLAPQEATVGTHQFTVTVTDSADNLVTQTYNYVIDDVISTVDVSDVAADHNWGDGDLTRVIFPIAGDLTGFSIGPTPPVFGANGLFATVDTINKDIVIGGPPTSYGNAEISVKVPLLRNNTQVATISRTFSLMSHQGTGPFGNFTCRTRPYVVGKFLALNPLKPWYNAPALSKNQTYTVQLAANNTLPMGLSLDSLCGQIYGTPLAADVAQSQIEYLDATGTVQGTATILWDIQASSFAVIDQVASGQVQTPYSLTLATSSSSPLTGVTIYRGSLPEGLAAGIDSTGLAITVTGTPTEAGYFDVWFQIVNANGQKALYHKRIVVDYITPLVVLTDTLPQVITNTAYSTILAAFGGTAPYTWTVSNGSLPTGLILNASTGVLSGNTSVTAYSQTVTFTVTDARGVSASVALLLAINNALAIATTTLPLVSPGANYQFQLQGTGGTAPYTWALGNGSPALPGGFTLSSTGLLSGATALTSYNTNVIVQITDAANNVVTKTFQLAIGVASGLLIDSEGVGTVVRGQAYQGVLKVDGAGLAPYNWAVAPDSPNQLPAGLVLATAASNSGATATISGLTNTALLNYSVKIQVVDANANVAYAFVLLSTMSTLAITTNSLPQATRTGSYLTNLTASGVNAPFAWSLDPSSPALPAGMALSAVGVLSGVPSNTGITALVFRVTDAIGDYATRTLNFNSVESTLAATTAALANVVAGLNYSVALSASGGQTPYTWSVAPSSQATLPPGLSLNASNGLISGVTTAVGFNRSVTFRVTDAIGVYREKTIPMAVVSNLKVVAGPDYVNSTANNSLGVVGQGDTEWINPRPNLSFYVVATGVVSNSASGLSFGLPPGYAASVDSLANGVAKIKITGPFAQANPGTNSFAMNVTDSGVSISATFTFTRYQSNAVFLTPASGAFPVITL